MNETVVTPDEQAVASEAKIPEGIQADDNTFVHAGDEQADAESKKEAESVDDILNQALAEFDDKALVESKEDDIEIDDDEPLTKKQLDELLKKERKSAENTRKANEDVNAALDIVGKDLILDRDELKQLLDLEAQKNDRFYKAWLYRDENPMAWKKVLEAKHAQYAERFGTKSEKPDITSEVTSAVLSASTTAPTPEKEPDRFSAEYQKKRRAQMAKKRGFGA